MVASLAVKNIGSAPEPLPQQSLQTAVPLPEKVNILVVDDLREKLLVYRTILDDLQQNIMFAGSGEEALKLVLQNEFAVILLDVNMPGMDGLETADLIRKRRKSAHTPIIFLTAFADEVHLEQGYASGAVDYLTTPVQPEILRAKVRVFIELSQMRQLAARQAEEQARLLAAEEAARRKDAFLGMLAHELRNPLYPIRNAIHVLRSIPGTPEAVHMRTVIDRQVTHMARLVDDLLDSTRLAHGKTLLKKEPCRLSQIVWDISNDYDTIFNEKGISFDVDIPQTPVWIQGDPTRLAQLVGNVLHNACKFTDPGGKVAVRLVVAESDKTASVEVRDTGVGIKAADLPYVFDVFYQTEQGLDRGRGGLGLGLFLVKSLTELHGGKVSVESEGLHRGSTFTLSFPLTEPPAVSAKILSFAPKSSVRRRILLIEDNPDAALTTRLLLEHDGHEVRTAYSGAEGLELAAQFLPQVILCDIGLPGMDGYQVARALRQNSALQSAFIVALTGYGREEDIRQAMDAGFNLHLTKPIELVSLRETMSRLGEKPVARPVPEFKTGFSFRLNKNRRDLLFFLIPSIGCGIIEVLALNSPGLPLALSVASGFVLTGTLFYLLGAHNRRKEPRLPPQPKEEANKNATYINDLNHAMRTPLTTIGGVAEILQSMEGRLDPNQKQLVDALLSSTKNLKTLINDAYNSYKK